MKNYGFKVSAEGETVGRLSLQRLIVDSTNPVWKCDLRPTPKHFGIVKATVTLAPGEIKTLLDINHNYNYTPSFIIAWSYPAGIGSLGGNSTYGLGDIEISDNTELVYFYTRMDSKKLVITADNSINLLTHSNLYVELRYYIFADDFPLYTSIPIRL